MVTDQERLEIRRELELRLGGYGRADERSFATSALARGFEMGNIRAWERREPIQRQRSIREDFALPLLSSVTTGGMIGLAAGALFQSLGVGCAVALGVTTLSWLMEQRNIQRLNWRLERITGRDLDGDGWVGEPEPQPRAVDGPPSRTRHQVEDSRPIIVNTRASVTGQPVADNWPTLDVSSPNRRLARDWAEFLTIGANDGFAIREWTGRELSSGTQVTDPMWREWTATLKQAGILEVNGSGTRLAVPLDNALRSIFAG